MTLQTRDAQRRPATTFRPGRRPGAKTGGGSSTSQEQQSGEQPDGQSGEQSNEQSSGDGPQIIVKPTSEATGDGGGNGDGGGWGISEGGQSQTPLTPAIEVNLDKAITDVIPAGSGHGYRVLNSADDMHVTHHSEDNDLGGDLRQRTREAKREGAFTKILEESSAHTNRMRRKLERALQSKMERTWRGGFEEGTLNSRALASALSGNQAIYRSRQDVEELDTCVCMMLDASSSIQQAVPALALQSVIALSKLFDKMGIPFMVACFNMDAAYTGKRRLNSYKRQWDQYADDHGIVEAQKVRPFPIAVYMLKQFEEQLKTSKDRIAAYQGMVSGSNIDGCAVPKLRITTLLPRHEKRKILLTFSDGQPCRC